MDVSDVDQIGAAERVSDANDGTWHQVSEMVDYLKQITGMVEP